MTAGKLFIRWRLLVCCVLVLTMSSGLPLSAKSPKSSSLTPNSPASSAVKVDEDLESILNLEVSSVKKKRQQVQRLAASVFVLNEQDIRSAGVTNIPELLRMVPGVHVSRVNTTSYAVSIHGFNDPNTNKVLVMVDGRSIVSPLFNGVLWEVLDYPIDLIARIEVIRGPVAADWGANAVNGVINIITKSADQAQKRFIRIRQGNDLRTGLDFGYGDSLNERFSYRIYGQFVERNQQLPVEGGDQIPVAKRYQTGFRLDWNRGESDSATFQGDLATTNTRVFVDEYSKQGRLSPPETLLGNIIARWSHNHKDGSHTTAQIYYDHFDRGGQVFPTLVKTLDGELQHRRHLGEKHELQLSATARSISDTSGSTEFVLTPRQMRYTTPALSISDDIELIPGKVQVSLSTRIERHPFSGWNAQPSATFAWTPSRKTSVWSSLSYAMRTPTRLDRNANLYGDTALFGQSFSRPAVLRNNPNFQPEQALAAQSGYRYQWSLRYQLDVSAHFTRHTDLGAIELDGLLREAGRGIVVAAIVRNKVVGNFWGGDVSFTSQITPWWKVSSGYSYFAKTLRDVGGNPKPSLLVSGTTPPHMGLVRNLWQIGRKTTWSINAYIRGQTPSNFSPRTLGRNFRLDSQISYRVGDLGEFFISGIGLTRPTWMEDLTTTGVIVAPARRSILFGWAWRL
jgi:iron complex outermembrane recepter protein